jgi:hypothetical protein
MVLQLIRALLGAPGLLATVAALIIFSAAWHQRRDARTTRLRSPGQCCSSARECALQLQPVHRIFDPSFVTIAKRPSYRVETAAIIQLICPTTQMEYFCGTS